VPARHAGALILLLLLAGGCSLAGRSLGGYVDDKIVRGAVKRRLAIEHVDRPGGVRVDTFGGTVYLSGAVDTAEQKSDAELVAWGVAGVQQVVNDLVVRHPAAAVSALPDFRPRHPLAERLPGVARVEQGRPGGPDLAYDDRGRVVASIYTLAWREVIDAGLATLSPPGLPIDHVSTYALPERPDLPGPVYAVVLWHVSEPDAATLR
jgi:hyperosmotically inducible periplasmic protein